MPPWLSESTDALAGDAVRGCACWRVAVKHRFGERTTKQRSAGVGRPRRGLCSVCRSAALRAAMMLACMGFAHAHAGPLEELTNYTGAELYQEHCASCHGV